MCCQGMCGDAAAVASCEGKQLQSIRGEQWTMTKQFYKFQRSLYIQSYYEG